MIMTSSDATTNKQYRRVLLTINNPEKYGITHDTIKDTIKTSFPTTNYFCMSDEIGAEGTYHIHLVMQYQTPVRFTQIKRHFPTAHIDSLNGTILQARDYVEKTGKWQNSPKSETSVVGTFEEWGVPKENKQGRRTDLETLYSMVKDGASDIEILDVQPRAMMFLDKIERVRQTLKAERYSTEFRQLDVTYIWGPTGTGKTRGVMEEHGYDKVCRVTDYDHPFERYNGEDVLIFDEFRSQLRISDMLNYLDGYPLMLPCRYANRQACYTKVYLILNIPLDNQYRGVQMDEPLTWKAFLRRIHHVVEYTAEGCNAEPVPVQEALAGFTEINGDEGLPF